MATGDATPFEIFRPGTHTATSGRSIAFSDADVSAIAAAYDPALHEAPIVVGHPRDDAPAYGWVAGLQVDAGALRATPQQLDPAFAELVTQGRFKKVSASFYAPDSPTNPKPGVWYLRHVGFLGASPPAVKGLKPVAFAENEAGVVEFAESWTLGLVARLFGTLRDAWISQFGAEAADKALPRDTIDIIAQAEAALPAAVSYADPPVSDADRRLPMLEVGAGAPLSPNPETPMPDPTAPALKDGAAAAAAALAAREAAIVAREASFAEREAATRRADDAAFVDGLVKTGKLPKGLAQLTAGILGRADGDEAVSFAEGQDGKPGAAQTAHAALKQLLAALPVQVDFRETAAGAAAPPTADGTVDGITAAADALIKRRADAGQTIDFREAVAIVTKEKSA